MYYFFFSSRRRHTRCSRDWSSDVCSSDLVDAANRAGPFSGRSVVIQSTPHGQARALNAQDGLFTLVERGLEHGAPVERTRLIGAISRALIADAEWPAVRDLVARPELQVIVSNVTEVGFRPDAGFPARLTDLLHTRFVRLPDGPPVFVIPPELVDQNGPRLAALVHHLPEGLEHPAKVPEWHRARVWFRSEEHTSELQSRLHLVCRLLLEKKKKNRDMACIAPYSTHPA